MSPVHIPPVNQALQIYQVSQGLTSGEEVEVALDNFNKKEFAPMYHEYVLIQK